MTADKIERQTVADINLRDPQLRVRVRRDGTTVGSNEGTAKRSASASAGVYEVTFNSVLLNGGTGSSPDTVLSENCAITATARSSDGVLLDSTPVSFNLSSIGPNTVKVIAKSFDVPQGRLVDTSFDILASC